MAKVIVDAFGGDNAPLEVIKGAAAARAEWGIKIVLSGSRDAIERKARENAIDISGFEIIDAEDVIGMHDDPGEIVKSKRNSSMAVGLTAVAEGRGDAFLSAGSTGALVMGSTFLVKRIKGVKRPALAAVIPTPDGFYILLDSGANVECRPEMLRDFGVMGSIYAKSVLGVENPRVGLLNVGAEETKGGELQLESHRLLKEKKAVNFIGNVEARDVPGGACDVVVTDGFSGNIVLKLTEGVAMTFFKIIKSVLLSKAKTKIAALFIKKELGGLRKHMDYSEYGGAPLVGIKAPIIKAHGSSDAKAFKNAIKIAAKFADSGAVAQISEALEEAKGNDNR